MEWVKLDSSYYLDAAVMRAGDQAELLFVRAMAYCGNQENGGVVPTEALPRLMPTRGRQAAAALVREGLWVEIPQGWAFVSWERHQASRPQLEQKRAAGRERQARWRANRTSNGVRNGVTHASVTGTEVEEEVDTAAAAADTREPPPLPEPVEILRRALEAHKLFVRWDRLTPTQLDEIVQLVDLHGDGPLVASAMRSFRPAEPPGFASAWLGQWRDLSAPGTLRAVPDQPCPHPGHSGSTRHCPQCAAERLEEVGR